MIEMNRDNIRIDPMMDVNTDWDPFCISAYIEMWFDVDEKFGIHTHEYDDTWINLCAIYSPICHTLQMKYYIETDTSLSDPITYESTETERKTIIEMIEEKCQEIENCSCMELLLEAIDDDERKALGAAPGN